ncbi:MAG: Gfo/Idh/MocA family oxidoreductase, partial [Caldilineaceae bacterium]|nr:Gfo/Idh/MocA family oxidoreductase [Caldilineaceae bacterium]
MSEIGVGLVGYKFMGRAHSNAYRQAPHFFNVDPTPRMVAICGRDEASVKEAAENLGWEGYETDYEALVARPDIQLIDVSTPGDTHKDVVLAALKAGKHVICEKPLANNLAEAREMLEAAKAAGTVAVVNYNYRRVPAVQWARKLIEDGVIGEVRHWRAVYLQEWIMPHYGTPMIWRLDKDVAGSGALGDLGAHIIDLAHYLVGGIKTVAGLTTTFIKERATDDGGTGVVDVDDAFAAAVEFENGATGTFEATRFAAGRKNYNCFEINGEKGSVRFNLERLNEVDVFWVGSEPQSTQGWTNVLVSEGYHP